MNRCLSVIALTILVLHTASFAQTSTASRPTLEFRGNKIFSAGELLGTTEKCLTRNSNSKQTSESDALFYCLAQLKFFFYSKGYLQAAVGKPTEEQTAEGPIIIVSIEEGALFHLGKVEVKDSKLFSGEQLLEMLDMKTGDIADGERLSKWAYERVKSVYSNLGYIQYTSELEPTFHLKAGGQEGVVDLVVTIDEGSVFTIGSIKFEGNGNVPDNVLQHEMLVRTGEVFNPELFKESLKRISQMGQFEAIDPDREVDYHLDRKLPRVNLTIHLQKKAEFSPPSNR